MANDLSSDVTIVRQPALGGGMVWLFVETPATADDGDYFDITLADYGIKTFEWILGNRHTTTDSVLVTADDPTTAVSSGVLRVTIGGSTDNKKRTFMIVGSPT